MLVLELIEQPLYMGWIALPLAKLKNYL